MKDLNPVIRGISTEKEQQVCAEMITGSEPWITLGVTFDHAIMSLNDPLHEVFVAYVEEEIVGVVIAQVKGAFSGYIKTIVVKAGWRDKNLGKILTEFIENRIFAKSPNVFLCVSSFNLAAQKFYVKLGYKEVGLLKDYIISGYDEILMRKTTGPILEKAEH